MSDLKETSLAAFFSRSPSAVRKHQGIAEALTENYLDPHDPRPPVSVPQKLGACKACGFKGLVRPKPGQGQLCTDCYSKNESVEESEAGPDDDEGTPTGSPNYKCERCGAPETEPGWGLCTQCRREVFPSESAEDFMDKKFKDCTETTMSGAIGSVPMGFKGLKKDERTPVESVHRIVRGLLNEELYNDRADDITFKAGDTLKILAHKAEPGKGLSYPAMTVKVSEDGSVGGWDVYDGIDVKNNSEVSFYGFSVDSVNEAVRHTSPRRRVSEEIDQSIFSRLLHYKQDIPDLIGTIEGIISSHNPADSEELFDELAEVVNLLAKADHTLAGLITSKNLRTPGQKPAQEEPETLEREPAAGAPMDRPDETRA